MPRREPTSLDLPPEMLGGAAFALGIKLAEKVSRMQMAVTHEDLSRIQDIRRATLKAMTSQFQRIESTVETRLQNLPKYENIQVVSLGTDCLPRTVCTRWGLKAPAKLGENTHPFDLAIHPTASVDELLRSNFAGYFDESLSYSEQEDFVTNTRLRILFNHDHGRQFVDNGFQGLRDRYKRRIENLIDTFASPLPAVYVHHTKTDDDQRPDAIARIFDFVLERRSERPTVCIWLDTPKSGAEPNCRWVGPADTVFLQIPFPFAGYVWHKPEHSFSGRGIKFERSVIAGIEGVLEQKGWIAPSL